MADYIRRDIVLKIINTVNDTGGFAGYADYCTLFDEIDTMPASDVKPVKYSSWEYRTYPIVDGDGVARRCMRGYVCKACGHGEPEEKRFCGGCGAEMRGEDNG